MSQQQFKGLTDSQVQQSRAEHGANVLTPKERRAAWKLFLDKFREPLIIILLVASIGISIYEYHLDGEFKVFFEPIGIFAAIFLATGLGFIFERKADKEFNLLNKVSDDEAVQVWRNGVIAEVPKKDIVVGDIVVLNTGGEIPAVVITDAIVRLLPGALGDEQSALSDSFQDNLLAPPVYTRPAEYKGWGVPEVLLSGHQANIDKWHHEQAIERTRLLRPDLLGE